MSQAKAQAAKALTIGKAADTIWALREKKLALTKQVTALEAEITALSEAIMKMLDEQDTRKGEGKRASVSINTALIASPKEWSEFMKFIIDGKRGDKYAYGHLVQHRVSDPAYRELRALGVVIPGLEDFNKRTLSITTLSNL